jgi:uncharacterized membrane protein YcaP (DUF421 family)
VINYLVVRFLYGHGKLDRVVEGKADVLIENGHLKKEKLRKDLITLPELEAAAHRQGFASLDEVQHCVIEPGGTITFLAKKPAPEEARHLEVLKRLDQVMRELAQMRGGEPQKA